MIKKKVGEAFVVVARKTTHTQIPTIFLAWLLLHGRYSKLKLMIRMILFPFEN
jgi:hypothetical protein